MDHNTSQANNTSVKSKRETVIPIKQESQIYESSEKSKKEHIIDIEKEDDDYIIPPPFSRIMPDAASTTVSSSSSKCGKSYNSNLQSSITSDHVKRLAPKIPDNSPKEHIIKIQS